VAYSQRNLTACPHTPHIDALATGPHSVLFHRFYSGPQSPAPRCWLPSRCFRALLAGRQLVERCWLWAGAGVCSPTRASVLTGRTNKRSCINSALPCDHMGSPAWACSQGPGLAANAFTVAHAASKLGMATLHLGKWHLGDLFEKEGSSVHSNPTDHGFAEWFTSQAQLPTSTPNCGCFPPPDWAGPLRPADFPESWNGSDAPNVNKFKHT